MADFALAFLGVPTTTARSSPTSARQFHACPLSAGRRSTHGSQRPPNGALHCPRVASRAEEEASCKMFYDSVFCP